jgi:hypothetical protein
MMPDQDVMGKEQLFFRLDIDIIIRIMLVEIVQGNVFRDGQGGQE